MTITSKGYPGQIFPNDWANLSHQLGNEYSAHGPAHYRVTAAPGGTRQVVVGASASPSSPHVASGKGVTDYNDAPITTAQAPVVTGGSRYDLVVLHRDWPTKTSSVQVITGTSVRALPPRATRPSPQDDQPLALVRWDANNSTTPGDIIDLRVWQGDGGATAVHPLALTYLMRAGSRVRIGDDDWYRGTDGDGDLGWRRVSLSSLPLYGWGENALSLLPGQAVTVPAGNDFKVQAGTTRLVSEGVGYARLTFPKPFPNGLLTVLATSGDDNALNGVTLAVAGSISPGHPHGFGNGESVVFRVWGPVDGGERMYVLPLRGLRVNWIAIGW